MSHAAIVAREYGLPAVVGTGQPRNVSRPASAFAWMATAESSAFLIERHGTHGKP